MALQGLEIRRSSATLRGGGTGLRKMPTVAKYIDTTICIGCKACEVACQEWNDLPLARTEQTGTYQTLPTLAANYWNLIQFREIETKADGLSWLMRKDQCMHCDEPGCLEACPAPGAIIQYVNGIVDVDPERCIGCGLCETGCPFDVPRYAQGTNKMAKCTLCVDRVSVGLEPACIKACPTGCLQFGDKASLVEVAKHRVDQLKSNGYATASYYDPQGVGGTGVITVLKHGDHPEEELLSGIVFADVGILRLREPEVLDHVEFAVVLVEHHVPHPEDEHHSRGGRERHSQPGVQPAADGKPAEQVGHPAEDRGPDRHPAEQRAEEEHRDHPVDHPGRETVTDDLVSDEHVLPRPGDVHHRRSGHMRRPGNAQLAHTWSPSVSRAVSWGFFGPKAMKWPMAPNTAAAMAMNPMGCSTRFQTLTVVGTVGSFGSPYHSGWSPCFRTVMTPVPPTPCGS